jgi:hypothetical protein
VHPIRWLRAHVAPHITHARIDAAAALIIAAATVLYTTFAYRQWLAMRDQLTEMRSSSAQTAATIAALQDQATALKTQLGLLKDNNRISEAALTSNMRAWLGAVAFTSDTDLESSAFPTLRVEIQDFGRQPAENVVAQLHIDYGDVAKAKGANPDTFPVWSEHANELAWESACK